MGVPAQSDFHTHNRLEPHYYVSPIYPKGERPEKQDPPPCARCGKPWEDARHLAPR